MSLTPQQTKVQGCKWDHAFDPRTDTNTGFKWDHRFDHKYRLGVNGTMDLITSTGSKSDHRFDPKQTQVQGVNETIGLTVKQTKVPSANGSMSLTA